MGYELPQSFRAVEFHILRSLHDHNPIIVTSGCYAIDFAPVSDSYASVPW